VCSGLSTIMCPHLEMLSEAPIMAIEAGLNMLSNCFTIEDNGNLPDKKVLEIILLFAVVCCFRNSGLIPSA
jgi:hypothetical protein